MANYLLFHIIHLLSNNLKLRNTPFNRNHTHLLTIHVRTINHMGITSKLLKFLKPKEDTMIRPIAEYKMTDFPKYCLHFIRVHIYYITDENNAVNSMIQNMIFSNPNYKNTVQLLCTILDIKHDNSITIISK